MPSLITAVNFDAGLWLTALLTMTCETAVLWLLGWRRCWVLTAFALSNLISNLLLNELMRSVWAGGRYFDLLIPGELAAWGLEYAVCVLFVYRRRGRLLFAVIAANVISFTAGLYLPR